EDGAQRAEQEDAHGHGQHRARGADPVAAEVAQDERQELHSQAPQSFLSTPFSRWCCTWARDAARGSWVTITIVLWNSRLRVSMRARMSSALLASRSP